MFRQVHDRVAGYNLPAAFDAGSLMEEIPQTMLFLDKAFVSRREVVNSQDGVRFASMAQWFSRGAIYDCDRRILPEFLEQLSEQPGKFDHPEMIDAQRVAKATRIEGRCLYLGTLHGHFGHFLIESLARAWSILRQKPDVRVIFHFANATPSPIADLSKIALPSFVLAAFRALDIGEGRLIFANCDLLVEELMVPTAQFRIHMAGAPGLCEAYDHIRDNIRRRRPDFRFDHRRLYLTRRRLLASGEPAQTRKSIVNEDELERLFSDYGFEIVSPERHSFEDQVMMIGAATHIAGTTGSALHMSLFNNRPETKLIAIDWRNSKTQYILDAVRGIDSSHIYCLGGRDKDGLPFVDVDVVERSLEHIMGEAPISATEGEPPKRKFETRRAVASIPVESGEPAPFDLSAEKYMACFSGCREILRPQKTLPHQAMVLWCFLNEAQRKLDIRGDLLLLGSGIGAIDPLALLLAQENERVIFIEKTEEELAQLTHDVPSDVAARAQFLDLSQCESAALTYRMCALHPLAYDEAELGLASCARLAHPNGLILLDSFFDPEHPDVSRAAYDFLAKREDWDAFFIGFNYLILAPAPMKRIYAAFLAKYAKDFFRVFGTFAFRFDAEINGSRQCIARGAANKALQSATLGLIG